MTRAFAIIGAGAFGAVMGGSLVAAITDSARDIQMAERSALFDVSMDGNMIYLGCLKDDCRAEKVARDAVVAVAENNLCKRGYAESCPKREASK